MKFIDMFCGIGGFRYGLEQASEEFKCVWANDNDKNACKIYRKHFGEGELIEGDIQTIDADTIPDHDLLCAGFPCQSFSIAGNRRGYEDTRGTLFFEICRILRAKKPSYALLENVKGLLSHNGGSTFETIIRTLDELGYDCQWQVLNSFDFGKGERPRIFILAILRDYKDNARKRIIQAFPLPFDISEGLRYARDNDEQENRRSAERIIREYARLPDWLDSWDSFYPKEEVPRERCDGECYKSTR